MTAQISTVRTLDEDTFIDRFSPRLNHLDTHAPLDFGYGGCLFETSGAELDYVLAQNPKTIWKVLDSDGNYTVILD